MNLISLILANLRFRKLTHALNLLMLALGVALIVTLLHTGSALQQRFTRDLDGIDLVVGAKGSPLQLILSSVFHLDIPTGNIPLEEMEKLKKLPAVKQAIPLALGDNYHGYRIVGTSPDYIAHYAAQLAQGKAWTKPMQVILGAEVARMSSLALGQKIAGSHGLGAGGEEHAQSPYEVVGILAPSGSVLDRLILTDVGSVWEVHAHHHHHEEAAGHAEDDDDHDEDANAPREITALLIHYSSPYAAVTLPRQINKNGALQAASPAMEMTRLYSMVGAGADALEWFGALLILLSGLGFFVTLFQAVQERRRDLALMRALGATRGKLCTLLLAEGLLLGISGAGLGMLLGHGLAYALRLWLEKTRHLMLSPIGIHPYEIYLLLGAMLLSILAALIPAFMAYRADAVRVLTRG